METAVGVNTCYVDMYIYSNKDASIAHTTMYRHAMMSSYVTSWVVRITRTNVYIISPKIHIVKILPLE
jgi:hypothetical protein